MTDPVAPHILALNAYEPGKPAEELARELGLGSIVKLASNENPHGPSPRVAEALVDLGDLHRYPDPRGYELREALGAHHACSSDEVLLGNGSNELIDLLCRVCASRGEHAVFGHPSFPCYRIGAIAQELDYAAVPLDGDLRWNVDALLAAITPQTRLLFVSNPNNPTGSVLGGADLRRLVDEAPDDVLLVLDEAYVEYVDAPDFTAATELRGARERLVVLRTFSKAYGLAALRVGYLLGTPGLVSALNRLRAPFNVNAVAQRAARIALEDQTHLAASVAATIRDRSVLAEALADRGLETAPSHANFVLTKMPESGRAVYEALLREGVIVRSMGPPLERWIRVTVGLPEENERFLASLDRVL